EFATRGGARRNENTVEAELRALLQPALGLGRGPEAAGQTDLAEGGETAANRRSLRCRGDRERDREIRAGLVDADAACDVDEDVSAAERNRGMPPEHGDDHREPFRVNAGANPPR